MTDKDSKYKDIPTPPANITESPSYAAIEAITKQDYLSYRNHFLVAVSVKKKAIVAGGASPDEFDKLEGQHVISRNPYYEPAA